MISHIFQGNAALFPLPPLLVHCQIAVAYFRHKTDTMVSVSISGHGKGHVDGSALLRRRAASGLDVGHPSQ